MIVLVIQLSNVLLIVSIATTDGALSLIIPPSQTLQMFALRCFHFCEDTKSTLKGFHASFTKIAGAGDLSLGPPIHRGFRRGGSRHFYDKPAILTIGFTDAVSKSLSGLRAL